MNTKHENLDQAMALIRTALQSDGGDIEIVKITDDNKVIVRLLGQCKGCPNAGNTLRNIVIRTILKMCPDIKGIEVAQD